jgi:hypothetical protein
MVQPVILAITCPPLEIWLVLPTGRPKPERPSTRSFANFTEALKVDQLLRSITIHILPLLLCILLHVIFLIPILIPFRMHMRTEHRHVQAGITLGMSTTLPFTLRIHIEVLLEALWRISKWLHEVMKMDTHVFYRY